MKLIKEEIAKAFRWLAFKEEDKIWSQILKNQELAEQWQIYLDGGFNFLFEIHERLKKRIEEYQITKIDFLSKDDIQQYMVEELQKILGEEK